MPELEEIPTMPEPEEIPATLEHFDDGAIAGLGELDRSDRIGRTALQVGIPAAIVGIGSWLARLNGVDLDPGAGIDLPADVAGYFVALIAFGLSFGMNRRPKA